MVRISSEVNFSEIELKKQAVKDSENGGIFSESDSDVALRYILLT